MNNQLIGKEFIYRHPSSDKNPTRTLRIKARGMNAYGPIVLCDVLKGEGLTAIYGIWELPEELRALA